LALSGKAVGLTGETRRDKINASSKLIGREGFK
jgi:hypothetical protein